MTSPSHLLSSLAAETDSSANETPAKGAEPHGTRDNSSEPSQPVTTTVTDLLGLSIGEVFKGPSRTLNEAHFLFFSGLTGDNHPIHYDVEYAKGTRFGKPLTHGLLLASLTALGASPISHKLEGFVFVEQGCRYLKPVVLGDTIQPQHFLDRVWSERGRCFARFATALVNQRGEIVLEGFHVYRVLDRNATSDGNQPSVPGPKC